MEQQAFEILSGLASVFKAIVCAVLYNIKHTYTITNLCFVWRAKIYNI